MATARSVTVGDIIDWCNYELRNTAKKQYVDDEMIVYVNKSLELLHQILVAEASPLVRTGSRTITTVAGTCEYNLGDNGMGDLWMVDRIWTPGSDPLDLVDEASKASYQQQEDDGNTGGRSEPTEYFLTLTTIGLLPFPDDEYIYNILYYPNYVPVQDRDDTMPYLNLFNMQVVEAVKLVAKNREATPSVLEPAMMEIFQDRALAISRRREGRSVAITIRR